MVLLRTESLMQICNDVVISSASHDRRTVTVATLCPRDVTSTLVIVKMAKEIDRRWKFDNTERLRRLEQAADLLAVLEAPLLPSLGAFPNAPQLVRAIDSYARKLSEHAMAAGGHFATQAEVLRTNLMDYVRKADAASDDDDLRELHALIAPLTDEVTSLLNTYTTIAQK